MSEVQGWRPAAARGQRDWRACSSLLWFAQWVHNASVAVVKQRATSEQQSRAEGSVMA